MMLLLILTIWMQPLETWVLQPAEHRFFITLSHHHMHRTVRITCMFWFFLLPQFQPVILETGIGPWLQFKIKLYNFEKNKTWWILFYLQMTSLYNSLQRQKWSFFRLLKRKLSSNGNDATHLQDRLVYIDNGAILVRCTGSSCTLIFLSCHCQVPWHYCISSGLQVSSLAAVLQCWCCFLLKRPDDKDQAAQLKQIQYTALFNFSAAFTQ